MDYYNSGQGRWEDVQSLASLVASRQKRSPGDDLTLFKSLGMGISDLAVGIEIYRRAIAQGAGRPIEHPKKTAPRLRALSQVRN